MPSKETPHLALRRNAGRRSYSRQTVDGDEGGGQGVTRDWSIGVNGDKGTNF
ncbi:MAG: hypothetical protein UV37_C0002G0079, partial [Candidatus Collierbacteria bacterium GW2011_GWA1_42_60]